MKKLIAGITISLFIGCALHAAAFESSARNASLNTVNQGGISYGSHVENNGYLYVDYVNTSDNHYLLKYTYTNMNGNRVSGYVEAKPQVTIQTSVPVGKGTALRITECRKL